MATAVALAATISIQKHEFSCVPHPPHMEKGFEAVVPALLTPFPLPVQVNSSSWVSSIFRFDKDGAFKQFSESEKRKRNYNLLHTC